MKMLLAGGTLKGKVYEAQIRTLIQPLQDKLLVRWNFPKGQKGFAMLQSIFNESLGTDVHVQENIPQINAMLGFDWSWIPERLQAGQEHSSKLADRFESYE